MSNMYDVATDGCNLEIMGYPFFVENVSPTEAIRRRNMNVNNIVGGTQKVTKGEYVGIDVTVTTHVKVNPDRPDMWNSIFTDMMSKPVRVSSPELGDPFKAMVVIKPEHDSPEYLKLSISIKEIPGRESKIPGESFSVPGHRKINVKKKSSKKSKDSKKSKTGKSKTKRKSASKKQKSKQKK